MPAATVCVPSLEFDTLVALGHFHADGTLHGSSCCFFGSAVRPFSPGCDFASHSNLPAVPLSAGFDPASHHDSHYAAALPGLDLADRPN